MNIKGIANTTLLDYPGHVAATIYTGGCFFKCPFCFNKSLVLSHERLDTIPNEAVLEFLKSRLDALEGICITGGEPLLQNDLCDFMYDVKQLGLDIKLDTNGYDPAHLNTILKNGLVDYVSMDIKNCQEKYAKTTGTDDLELTRIKLSVDLLKDCDIPYEFRTTVTRELHEWEDMENIGKWLAGARAYYLQPYVLTDDVIMPVFSSYTKEEMLEMRKMLQNYINAVDVRGF
ncbi:MAG: anaerobic ribonucleoside-triphosphate reductase activating protein [Lachnospiraceae bacterium]|nr:anaerobic ribonucleoside-triphosphate reductase activating protein [Lachnospiraceae bacterium]